MAAFAFVCVFVMEIAAAHQKQFPVFTEANLEKAMKTVGASVASGRMSLAAHDIAGAKTQFVHAREELAVTISFWRERNKDDAIRMLRAAVTRLDELDTALSEEAVDRTVSEDIARRVEAACEACHAVYREQDPSTKAYRFKRGSVATLTAEDYVEIRRTALYYNLGWDNSASVDGGDIVSRSFTADSNFRRDGAAPWIGNKAVADAAARSRTGIHHWDSNLVIEPHPDGAKVFRYTLLVNVDSSGKPARVTGGGPLYEIFAKTERGWLIKDRYHYSAGSGKAIDWPRFEGRALSAQGNAAASQTSSRGESNGQLRPLTALDYVEIEMLYGWNNIALDSGAENGEMFARTFTPDGVFEFEGRTISGSKNLAELAAKGEHGLRRWLSNLYVEPSAEGAVGWAYQLDVIIGKSAAQTTVREGGLYRDVLVKTPDGWRFKSRVYTPGNTMPSSVPLPGPR